MHDVQFLQVHQNRKDLLHVIRADFFWKDMRRSDEFCTECPTRRTFCDDVVGVCVLEVIAKPAEVEVVQLDLS